MSPTRVAFLVAAVAFAAAASAAPSTGVGTEQPHPQPGGAPPQPATFGLCNAPQNADAFPSQPVPVKTRPCEDYQRFEATSPGPSTGSSCGGYTVAFGPMGDLKHYWKRYNLRANWADAPPTAATCGNTYVAATAWGWRCDNADCSAGDWELIHAPYRRQGTWNSVSNVCYTDISWVAPLGKVYKTLTLDIIGTVGTAANAPRKRVHGIIDASRGNGTCASASATTR
jgi:hypothetical protein